MGLMDKVKAQAQQAAAQAKAATSQAQGKVEQIQLRKKADEAAKKLGYLIHKERTGGAAAEAEAEALAADDADLAYERGEMAAALAAPAAADPWHPGEPDPLRDGLLIAALARPPSWSGPTSPPLLGAWCSCCGRSRRSGGRWWREAAEPKGWRCRNCYPPDHLRADQVVEVRT